MSFGSSRSKRLREEGESVVGTKKALGANAGLEGPSSSDRRSSSASAPGRERTGRPGDDGGALIASSSVGRSVNDRIEGEEGELSFMSSSSIGGRCGIDGELGC